MAPRLNFCGSQKVLHDVKERGERLYNEEKKNICIATGSLTIAKTMRNFHVEPIEQNLMSCHSVIYVVG